MPFKSPVKLRQLFFIFCKVSLFTVGGGLAMLPFIQREIVERTRWVEEKEFLDIFSVAQSLPGVMILNVATAVGYKIRGMRGALWAAVGTVVPPFLTILVIAAFFLGIKDNAVVERVFSGIRPAVIGLIAVPVVNLAQAARISRKTAPVVLAVIVALVFLHIAPSSVLLFGIILSLIFVCARIRKR